MKSVCLLLLLLCCSTCEFAYAQTHYAVGGLHYASWDGRQSCQPLDYALPASEAEVVTAVAAANVAGMRIKVVGAGHSFAPIAMTNYSQSQTALRPAARMLSLDLLASILKVERHIDGAYSHVTVGAGIRLHDLNAELETLGLALENMGATAQQSLAGATATGTHGTGRLLGSMSTQIVGLRLVLANGTIVTVSNQSQPVLFSAARVGLGSLGVVTAITLRVVDAFNMRLDTIPMDLDTMLKELPQLMEEHERLQWYFTPYTTNGTVVIRTPTTEPITGCWQPKTGAGYSQHGLLTGSAGTSCVDVSYKTLTGSQDHYYERALYTEMEMFIPAEHTLDAIQDFRAFMDDTRKHFHAEDTLFTGVRYVASDDIWLSPQNGRENAVISFIVLGDQSRTGNHTEFDLYAQGLERICSEKYQARVHWGKMNWANASYLSTVYPHFNDFNTLRRQLDPKCTFCNDYLAQRLQLEASGRAVDDQ